MDHHRSPKVDAAGGAKVHGFSRLPNEGEREKERRVPANILLSSVLIFGVCQEPALQTTSALCSQGQGAGTVRSNFPTQASGTSLPSCLWYVCGTRRRRRRRRVSSQPGSPWQADLCTPKHYTPRMSRGRRTSYQSQDLRALLSPLPCISSGPTRTYHLTFVPCSSPSVWTV